MPAADGTRAPRQPSPSVLSFGPRLAQIFRNEGFAALFAGWIPRTSAIATGGAVFLGIYDFSVNFGKENPSEAVEKVVS
jgi:solute carrier family 25 S-adenosylmethionine transporter 26